MGIALTEGNTYNIARPKIVPLKNNCFMVSLPFLAK